MIPDTFHHFIPKSRFYRLIVTDNFYRVIVNLKRLFTQSVITKVRAIFTVKEECPYYSKLFFLT